ncbi:MAG TPA: NIPSNAP family protein [Puia sp.]|nr:NIPSNAP family protein [Puia sp.]
MKKIKKNIHFHSCIFILFAFCTTITPQVYAFSSKPVFYQIRVYQLKDKAQEDRVDKFLQNAFLPALHRIGIPAIGVFKPIANDTAAVRRIYVLIPFQTLDQFVQLPVLLEKDRQFNTDGADYIDANYKDPAYMRMESILLQAFSGMTGPVVPGLKNPKSERIYELRSYEGASEKIHANKVRMFNDGDEISLFKRLDFNAVFYAEVISGAHMPNLMYMTSFENIASHDQHWKNFGDDPVWKKLSSMPEYQNNVSHIDIVLLHPAEYSDF